MGIPSYDQFVTIESKEVADAYRAARGHEPGPSDMYHNAWRRTMEHYEQRKLIAAIYVDAGKEPPFVPEPEPPPPPPPSKLNGRTRVEGRFFVNDAGTFRPKLVGGFALPSVIIRNRDQAQAYMGHYAEMGFDGFRIMAGILGWANQNRQLAIQGLPFVLEFAKSIGKVVEVTAITGSDDMPDPKSHLQEVAAICAGFDNVFGVEGANEYYHSSQSAFVNDVENMADIGHKYLDPKWFPWAIGAPPSDEPNDTIKKSLKLGRYINTHLDRSRDEWNMVRRIREMESLSSSTKRPVKNNEMIGWADINERGRRNANPAIWFAAGALNRLFEVVGTGHGENCLKASMPTARQDECAREFIRGSNICRLNNRLDFQNSKRKDSDGSISWGDSPVGIVPEKDAVRVYSGIDHADPKKAKNGFVVAVGISKQSWHPPFINGWRAEQTGEHNKVKTYHITR